MAKANNEAGQNQPTKTYLETTSDVSQVITAIAEFEQRNKNIIIRRLLVRGLRGERKTIEKLNLTVPQ